MNRQINVSVLVPVYNVEIYIERCARSLFEQTYNNIEYVFVDDCSQDNSIGILEQIIEEYHNRKDFVSIIKHKVNRGLSAARKTAILAASGEYIFHVDSDDYLELDCIEKLVNAISNRPADLVMCDYNLIYENSIEPVSFEIPERSREVCKMLFTRKITPHIWGKLIKRSLILEHNIYAREGLNVSEDYVVTPIIAYYSDKVVKVNYCLYNYIKYNQNSYTFSFSRKAIQCSIEACETLTSFFDNVERSDEFKNAANLAILRNAITLLSVSAISDYDIILDFYKDADIVKSPIELKYKVLLILVKIKLWKISSKLICLMKNRHQTKKS